MGGSIEDATGSSDNPLYPFELAVERIEAAAEACRGKPLMLNARAENYLYCQRDLADTIKKLQAFEEAGADVLYAPGITSLEELGTICREISKPFNALMGIRQPTFSLQQLEAVGVKRVSVGGGFARAAMTGFLEAAKEVMEQGTFTYSAKITSNNDAVHWTTTGEDKENLMV